MAQMRVTGGAQNFGASHEKAAVVLFGDGFAFQRRVKTGPACPAFKLGLRVEQGRATADTMKRARCFREIVVGMGAFCPMFARDLIGQIA